MTKAEKYYLSCVAEAGCIACHMLGYAGTPAEIHHARAGTGTGRRSSHMTAIALCPAHHRGTNNPLTPSIHLDRRAFIARFGTEAELLERTRRLIGGEDA